jgi:hypothetical protein
LLFQIVLSPFRSFCLFDVCDLYLAADKTAADEGKKVRDVLKVGSR